MKFYIFKALYQLLSTEITMLRRFRLAAVLLPVLCLLSLLNAAAQTPVALPTTMTTLNSSSAAAARGGMVVDASGNVFIADDVSSKIYMVNQSAGTSSTFIGSSAANCTPGAISSSGDGCTFANTKPAISARGIGIDPYGNVIIPGYGDNMVHILCRATSPLCTAGTPSPSALSPIQIPVGTMGLVAGCTVGSSATKASGADNAPAFMTASSTYSTSTFYSTSACSTTGTTYSPYGASGDVYGNVYYTEIASTTATERYRVVVGPPSYNGVTNPIYAVLAKNTAWSTITAGYVYTVGAGNSNATTPPTTTKGSACTTAISGWVTAGTATDAYGDGCLFTSSVQPSSTGYASAVVVDAAGNMIYMDETRGLRVFYVSDGTNFTTGTTGYKAGQAMKNAIYLNNKSYAGFTVAIPGYTYILAGTGATAISTTPTLGSSTTVSASAARRIAISPQGNVYIGVYNAASTSAQVYFYDMNTGYIRILLNGGTNPAAAGNYCNGTSGAKAIDTLGDGCPVGATSGTSYATFANGNSMLPLAVDAQGNLYIYDAATSASNTLVRKVLAQGMAPQTLNTAQTQTVKLHFPETETIGASLTPTFALSSNFDMGPSATVTPLCAQTADLSVDCTVGVTTTPSAAGQRSAGLTVTLPAVSSGTWDNGSATIQLGGTVTGSVLALDNTSTMVGSTPTPVLPITNAIFSSITPAGVAVDGAGNVYTMDSAHSKILESVAGTTYTLASSLPLTPSQIAVDQTGNVFAVGIGTSAIQDLSVAAAGAPSTYTSTTISYTPTSGTAAPQGIAVDQVGNLYVSDKTTGSIYRLTPSAGPLLNQITVATGFTNPASLAVDGSGNVYVSDPGAGAVYKLTPGLTGTYTPTTVAGVSAGALAVDAAGDLYVQSGTTVLEVPVSGPASVIVLTGLNTPVGLAVDGKGTVYSADTHNTSITQVVRNAVSYAFPNETTFFNGILTDAGNQATTASTALSNVSLVGGSANPCAATASILGTVTAGQACSISTDLIGVAGSLTPITNILTLIPAATTVGSVTFTGTLPVGQVVPTTTTVGTPTGTLLYSPSGAEATFVVTVAATTLPPGSVNVTVDSTTTSYPLTASGTNGVATVTVSGLTAGSHTISAAYLTNSNYTGSNSLPAQSFSIAKVTTAVSWTPTASTQQISAAIGTGVLNATASPSIAGNFTYTATPSGGSAGAIDASTYLGIGTYALAVTFTPNDLVDYTTSTGSVASYTVTKASTTASVGASTMVVAPSGGNYTSLSAALAALPVTGGTIYLKPGTYTGQNAISYPNVSLRGLGGDPTQVILTAEDGAFSSPFTGYLGTGSGSGNANASGDQGSSTLDVTKGSYMGATSGSTSSPIGVTNSSQYTPNNFYAEYLTIQNTYNTSKTTTSPYTYNSSTGLCTNTGTQTTLATLYNAGTLCSSQALALWIESDQAVLNNVNLTSQQDTLYAGSQGCGSYCTVARQYFWKGLITGDVDYLFGDAATVFDHTNIFTTWHGTTATGTETIEAQNKKFQTGSASDYLSGYVCNSCTLMSQSTGMTALFYGRPYGQYSTWIMLNSYVDQVAPLGWTPWLTNNVDNGYLATSTYAEFNTQPYTDPAVGTSPYPASIFGGSLIPTGGNIGAGVTGTREVTSTDPGTIEASNTLKTQLTAAQAAQYSPVNFLGAAVSSNTLSAGQSTTWNPVAALAAHVNSFASTGSSISVASGSSVTILGRPQTPGAGLIPTGTYTFYDGAAVLATGSLDASGEATLTTSSLTAGTHLITMAYVGDSNFAGSTSATPFLVDVTGGTAQTPTVTITPSANATYGASTTVTVAVAPSSGTTVPTGTVLFSLDGGTAQNITLTNGAYTFTYTSLAAGTHTLSAIYEGDSNFLGSTATGYVNVARVVLQVTANNATMIAGASVPSLTYTVAGFVTPDTQASATTGAPALTTSATGSVVGEYPINISTGTLASSNYTFAFTGGYLNVNGAAQATAVATGDTRTVTEPVFPATCQQLFAAITMVNDDIPTSVDATVTNPDGARIQAALNSCSATAIAAGTNLAVQLSMDGAGHSAFLTGPLTMPSNVTLLVDPAVVVFFSRNAQDYDKVPGTHTCGNISTASASNSCTPLIDIPMTSTNVGIMGYGKLDGRGGDGNALTTLLSLMSSLKAGELSKSMKGEAARGA